MIKFFRNKHKHLLVEGKTGNYIKYAFGEIIHVVIGVLFAVDINSKFNASKNEEIIRTLLSQGQKDLLVEINHAKRIYQKRFFCLISSSFADIIHKKIIKT